MRKDDSAPAPRPQPQGPYQAAKTVTQPEPNCSSPAARPDIQNLLQKQPQRFEFRDDINLRTDICRHHRYHPEAGHPETQEILANIVVGHIWDRISRDFQQYVYNCDTCCRGKAYLVRQPASKPCRPGTLNIYIIMEYCNGGDLSCFIRKRRRLPEATCRKFLQQLALALKFMRSHNVCHMDLKPQNLLLTTIPCLTLKRAAFAPIENVQCYPAWQHLNAHVFHCLDQRIQKAGNMLPTASINKWCFHTCRTPQEEDMILGKVKEDLCTMIRVWHQWIEESRTQRRAGTRPPNVITAQDDRRFAGMTIMDHTASSTVLTQHWNTETGMDLSTSTV
ncbi:hypothetical protein PR048_015708 [Dryococelus australis]|uniref:non-specific serine/threonine protein kinase n=1 Tax=Dryococelus australis TaxID=614101 RepID=A0ABQ9HIR8_9NEOP|nr:hypothetical protein PR048_015708 [Dryococelus australis]